jgi:ribosomal protein S18 acetylase RimI-like enzyme
VEQNLFALFRAMAGVLPDSEIVETEGLSRHLAFPHNPMFKGVWNTRVAPGDLDDRIDETIAWFQARNAPFFFWWIGPSTQPDDLGERLARRGLISMEEQQKQFAHGIVQTEAGAPGMVADLSRVNEAVLEQTPPGFTIEEIHDELSLQSFKQVFVEAYGVPEWAGQAWADAALRVGIGQTPWKMYLGRLDGEPVATNMLFNGGGVASVYGVATLPAARGKGIGGAITLQPLLEARSAGYRYAVLFSSEMGIHAYERIGFQLTDGRINRYLWRNV